MRRFMESSLVLLLAATSVAGCDSRANLELLLIAPFNPGLALAVDDPDTLRHALRPEVSVLRMVPRNVVQDTELDAAVGEANPDIVWIRADGAFDDRISALPPQWRGLLILSRPPAHPSSVLLHETRPSGPILVAPLTRSDHGLGEMATPLLRSLRDGATLREALGEDAPWRLIGDGDWKLVDR